MKKRIIWGVCLTLSMAVIMPLWAAQNDEDETRVKAESLRGEISLINLVNGLNLNESQLTQLINVNKELQELRKNYKEKGQAVGEELNASLAELKKSLIECGFNIPTEVGKKANEMKEKAEQLKEEYEAVLPPFQEKVEKVLSEAQKEVIATFKPCLLPPKSQKNPVRVGQASSNEGAINILRRLRDVPQKVYEAKKNDILQKQFARFEKKHGKLTDEEKIREQERLFGLVERVRAMSDDEFEITKEELANEFKVKDLREELSERLKTLTEQREKDKPKLNKTGKFFLNPKMLGILEAKLEGLKNFKPASMEKK